MNLCPAAFETSTSVIYSDSQAALRFLQKGNPPHSQVLYKSITHVVETLANRGVQIIFRWLPGHRDIQGNEIADQHAGSTARMIGPCEEPKIRYLSAISRQIKDSLLTRWKTRWKESWTSKTRRCSTARLTPEVTQATRRLHIGMSKAHSALLIQLRTGIIGFNEFLFHRRVPSVPSPRCHCDMGLIASESHGPA